MGCGLQFPNARAARVPTDPSQHLGVLMMPRCFYISGPMSGIPESNIPLFRKVAGYLRDCELTVVSPHEIPMCDEDGLEAWNRSIRLDMELLMKATDIVLLPGWPASKGACLELSVALGLGMRVHFWQASHLVSMTEQNTSSIQSPYVGDDPSDV